MKSDQIPYYAPDGSSLGFRSLARALQLVAGGFAKASYGKKKNLRAIWQVQEDGSNPVQTRAKAGTQYSFLENLGSGSRCWKLGRVDGRDADGVPVTNRAAFLQVVVDCTVL